MAKLYFRYGDGKSSDLVRVAYNYNEMGMNVVVMTPTNKTIKSKVSVEDRPLFEREINYIISDNSIYDDIKNMHNINSILVDDAHLLTVKHVEELFLISTLLNITVITYGNRVINDKSTKASLRLMELANMIEPVETTYFKRPKFEFYYGAMNASKTAKLLYKYYALKKDGIKATLIKPALDRDIEYVSTRAGLKAKADIVLNKYDDINISNTDFILVDEAQFLTAKQIDELKCINQNNVAVRCYGLKTDFKTYAFEGSKRLLEISDEIIKLKTICRCNDGAEFNARMDLEGNYIADGDTVAIDNGSVKYTSLCPKCYTDKVLKIRK